MTSQVLKTVTTSQEKHLLLEEISTLKNSLFQGEQGIKIALASVRPQVAQAIKADMAQTGQSNESYFKDLEKQLQKLPTVNLTLAFEPSQRASQKLSSWIKQNYSQSAIINFEINPQIIGGVIIVSNGKYHDFSVKKSLQDYFANNKETIMQMLK